VRLKESPSPYLGSKELSYCALRTQLLMSLHDCSQRASSSSKAAHGVNRAERDFFSRVRITRVERQQFPYECVSLWALRHETRVVRVRIELLVVLCCVMLLMSLHNCSQRTSSSKAAHGASRAERDFFSRVR
jgi:hypothetical protein